MFLCLRQAAYNNVPFLFTFQFFTRMAHAFRGGSGIPIYPKKNRQNTPKYPKFLQIYPKIIEALNTLYPKLEVSETNTYLVVLPFLAFLQMDCHYFPTITDHKKSLNGKMVASIAVNKKTFLQIRKAFFVDFYKGGPLFDWFWFTKPVYKTRKGQRNRSSGHCRMSRSADVKLCIHVRNTEVHES